MRIRALVQRIINQMRHDKRTMALTLIAPVLVLSLVYFILKDTGFSCKIVVSSAPEKVIEKIENSGDIDVEIIKISSDASPETIKSEVKQNDAIAGVDISRDMRDIKIYLDATNSGNAAKIEGLIQNSIRRIVDEGRKKDTDKLLQKLPPPIKASMSEKGIGRVSPKISVDYIYGSKDSTFFDNYGTPLIGIIVFFFVFLVAGINFLTERKTGTLEKMLSTPIRRGEIITGYVLGFSLVALLQTTIITLFVIYVLDLTVVGSVWHVFAINLLTAVSALSLGILFSTLANSEFQMVQFIPIVIIPQIFLCGLFELSSGWKIAGKFMPLNYTTDALTEVIIRGTGVRGIMPDILALSVFSMVFMTGNVLLLRKQRNI